MFKSIKKSLRNLNFEPFQAQNDVFLKTFFVKIRPIWELQETKNSNLHYTNIFQKCLRWKTYLLIKKYVGAKCGFLSPKNVFCKPVPQAWYDQILAKKGIFEIPKKSEKVIFYTLETTLQYQIKVLPAC